MARNYRRVPSSSDSNSQSGGVVPPPPTSGSSHTSVSDEGSSTATPSQQPRGQNRSLAERFQDKLYALGWVITAGVVVWWSGTWNVLRHPVQAGANLSLLQIVALLLGVNTVLMAYLTIYLPKVKGLTDSSAWEVYCPAVIPTMTGLGILAFILAIRATWPVWGFLAPLVLSIECLGLLFSLHFIPY